jgi:alkylated DNA repair dioxygenase AlkB
LSGGRDVIWIAASALESLSCALNSAGMENIDLPGARLSHAREWLVAADAERVLAALIREVPFTQHQVRMFGRDIPAPRLSAWIGDPGTAYSYSRVRHQPLPWTATLQALRDRLQREFAYPFNSVLVNRYRDGRDSMGMHADDEPELGAEPLIASISLGATRCMRFRQRNGGKSSLAIELHSGSLLLMAGTTQQNYMHEIAKTRKPTGERINLTFRRIQTSP